MCAAKIESSISHDQRRPSATTEIGAISVLRIQRLPFTVTSGLHKAREIYFARRAGSTNESHMARQSCVLGSIAAILQAPSLSFLTFFWVYLFASGKPNAGTLETPVSRCARCQCKQWHFREVCGHGDKRSPPTDPPRVCSQSHAQVDFSLATPPISLATPTLNSTTRRTRFGEILPMEK